LQVALALRVTSEAAAMDELEQELSKLLEKNVVGGVVSAGGTTKALSQAEATSYRYWVSRYGLPGSLPGVEVGQESLLFGLAAQYLQVQGQKGTVGKQCMQQCSLDMAKWVGTPQTLIRLVTL
jgi:hypothetical protein